MKELNFYLKTTASACKYFLNVLSDMNLLSWVILRADHEIFLFRRDLRRSSGLTLVFVASCEV